MAGVADIPTLRERWKSGDHIGEAKPYLALYMRKVRVRRRFDSSKPRYSFIPGATHAPYSGYLEAHSNWEKLPNIKGVEVDQTFEQNGLGTATIEIDNVWMREQTGVKGLFHLIERGWFSPFRGYKPPARPATHPEKNEWYEQMRQKSTQIMVIAGYGDARIPIHSGLIGATDIKVLPDKLQITARDWGQLLTDQRAFAWAKHPQVLDPITFADRLQADNVTQKGTPGNASSDANPLRLATDGNQHTFWLSKAHNSPDAQPWMSIKVPGGRYASVRIHSVFAESCYISVFHKNAGVWEDQGKGYTQEGIPWVKFIPTLSTNAKGYEIPEVQLGDDSTIRFTFTNLKKHNGGFRAGVREASGARRKVSSEAKNNRWILVDDASDVVRTVLQWMGLHDWEVESTGVRLSDKLVFNRQTSFMDIINKIAELTNYVFFLKPPENFDESNLASPVNDQPSMGVAVFRSNQAMPSNPRDTIESVADSNILQGIEAQLSDEPLPQHIRVRGKPLKKEKGGRALGGDRTPRVMAGYLPPWSRADTVANGGIKKVVVHYDNMLSSEQECIVACIFIAFRAALESAKASIQIPGFPPIQLDNQTSLFDRASGFSTRLWITQRHLTVTTGDDAEFTMTLGGSLIDLPDIVMIRNELALALAQAGVNPYPLATPTLEDLGGPAGVF
jgi:hypothetical protein